MSMFLTDQIGLAFFVEGHPGNILVEFDKN